MTIQLSQVNEAIALINTALEPYKYLPYGQSDVVVISEYLDPISDSTQDGFEYVLDEIRSDEDFTYSEQKLIEKLKIRKKSYIPAISIESDLENILVN